LLVNEGMLHLEGFKFLNQVMPKVFKLNLATQPFNFGNHGLKILFNYRVVLKVLDSPFQTRNYFGSTLKIPPTIVHYCCVMWNF
jgi:hypothetical protein